MTMSPSSTSTSAEPVRAFPSGATYVEALQDTALCFRGTDLAGAEVRVDALGRPRAISGNFASVFSVTVADGTRYAVKCFTREVPEQAIRYRAIGEHLAYLDDDWAVGFEYVDRGILVQGAWYPVLRMEWVEAVNLTRWIGQHVHDQAAVRDLAERFADLVADLAAAGVGHGDLQHGNLLVTADGSLKLVDYDGVYVPALAGMPAAETGHRNYQSPDRTAADFGPEVDRFSSWVVYLSLVALAADPALWRQLRPEDAEHLLLAESDFADPASSFRLGLLTGHPDGRLRGLAERFRHILLHDRAAPPPLERLGSGGPVRPPDTTQPADAAQPTSAAQQADAAQPTSGGPGPTAQTGAAPLPSWLAERVQPHVPDAPPSVRFTGRTPALVALTWALLVVLPFGVPAAIFAEEALAIADVAAVLAWAGCTAFGYRGRPESTAARAARAERDRVRRENAAAADRVARLDQESRHVAEAAERDRAALDERVQDLRRRHDERLREHQRAVRGHLDRIERDRQASAARAHLEEQRLLVLRQKEHLRGELAGSRLATAGIEGLGSTTNLEAVGVRTAADFVGVRYEVHGGHRVAFFVLVDGSSVSAAGVGEVVAGRVDQWRERLTAEATRTRPTSLPPDEQQAIDDRSAAERAALDAEHRQVLEDADATARALRAARRSEEIALASEIRTANTVTAQARVTAERAVAEAAVTLERAQRAAADVVAQADAFRPITYRKYLRFLLTGKN